MKMAKKLDREIALVFVVLVMGLLAGSVSAATFEEKIVVSEKNPFNIEFTVEETGVIYAEVELEGAIEEIGLVLKSPTDEVKREVWDDMPLHLKYEVSKDDIAEGTEWKISVRSGLSERAYGTLKITYPSDKTPPTMTITCSPENPTTDQQITFNATASGRSGIDRIEILVNAEKVEECFGSGSCAYIGGPYPAGTSVSYHAKAYDKTGNEVETVHKLVHISEARDINPPTVIGNTPVGTDVPVTTEITITFSEPMNKESAEDAFSLYPESIYSEVPDEFDWDENTTIFTPSSYLDYDTNYTIQIYDARDLAGNSLYWYEWEFRTEPPNNPPTVPNRPSGQTSGYIGTSYRYSTSTEDPDEDKIKYTFDWGDFTTSETEFMDSGETASLSHDWAEPGEYHVRVKATDDKGATSRWSELLIVTILAPTPTLSVSIFTNPVPSGESDEIKVQVFSDGNPVAGANVYLSSTLGSLYLTEGVTDEDGEFVSTYTAPLVSTTQRYTISATAEKEGYEEGINTVSDSIFIETIPALSVSISTNPMPSGESDEIIVQVFSDGNPVAGANVYLTSTLGSLDLTEGVTDDDGVFVSTYTAPLVSTTQRYIISTTVEKEGYTEGKDSVPNLIFVEQPPVTTPAPVVTPIPTPEETPTPAPTPPPSQPIVPIAIAAIAAVTVLIYILKKPPKPQPGKEAKKPEPEEEEKKQQYGAVSASSDPDGAVVLLDGAYQGISAMRMDNIPIGPHVVVFAKFGYFKCEKKAIVNADQTTHVHCDLTEIPEIKLKLSAEPTKIPADGKSKSTITIRIEDNNGIPIPVPEDVTVELVTNIGTVESPVKIPAGPALVTANLTSSTSSGTATIKATAEFLKGSTTVEFSHST